MTEQRQVTINDVLLLLGQAHVEIAFLRVQIADLEQRLSPPSNGTTSSSAVGVERNVAV